MFSCIVEKFNKWGFKQDRTCLVTNLCLYNINKNEVQRKIEILSIKAITKSLEANSNEFCVHIKTEYDYRFISKFRNEIFAALKLVYY